DTQCRREQGEWYPIVQREGQIPCRRKGGDFSCGLLIHQREERQGRLSLWAGLQSKETVLACGLLIEQGGDSFLLRSFTDAPQRDDQQAPTKRRGNKRQGKWQRKNAQDNPTDYSGSGRQG